MRFISKYENYEFYVRPEQVAYRMQPGGTVLTDTVQQPFTVSFNHEQMLPAYERLYAMQSFLGGDPRPFGAMPDMTAQAIVNEAGRVVDMTAEYRPDFHFSVFDTASIKDDDLREYTENKMLADPALGIDYVLLVPMAVPAPWPTYNECDLKTAVQLVKHGGFDVTKVMEYEAAHANRENWLIEFGLVLAEQQVKRNADNSLTVTI